MLKIREYNFDTIPNDGEIRVWVLAANKPILAQKTFTHEANHRGMGRYGTTDLVTLVETK